MNLFALFRACTSVILMTLLSIRVAAAQDTPPSDPYAPAGRHCAHGKRLASGMGKTNSDNPNPFVSSAHVALENQYDVSLWELSMHISNLTKTIDTASVRTRATATADLDTFAFELHPDLVIDSARALGQSLQVQRISGPEVIAVLPATVAAGQPFEVTIHYHGTAPTTGATAAGGDGYNTDNSPTWGNQITWSLSQPFAAYHWWPVKQVLNDKADSVKFHLTVPSGTKAGANGLLQGVDTLPGGRLRYHWATGYPTVYYLVSVAVGNYVDYSFYANPTPGDSILIQNYIYDNPQTLPNFKDDIDETADMMDVFVDKFGPYPFREEKYGHSMAPFSGGMEHQTMTTQGFFSFTLTAHELAHQWFGDDVTCSEWEHLFVNEGFASYCEYIALEALRPGQAQNYLDQTHQDVIAQAGGRTFVLDPTDVPRLFDYRLSYQKGAYILHMLRHEVNNDSLFFAACRTYLQNHASGFANTEDFRAAVETATGESWTWFFNQWFYGAGYPEYELRWNVEAGQFILDVTQFPSAVGNGPFQATLEVALASPQGDTAVRLFHDGTSTRLQTPVDRPVTDIALDPDNDILNTVLSQTRDTSLSATGREGRPAPPATVTLAPNPASGQLNVRYLGPADARWHIAAADGRVVRTGILAPGTTRLQLHDLAAGAYTFQLRTPTEALYKKLILN